MTDSAGFVVVIAATWVTIGVILSVVMGRRGHSSFGWLVLGTILGPLAVVLAVDARRHEEALEPAAVATRPPPPGGSGPVDVLVGYDGSPESVAAAHAVVALLGDRLGRLTVAWVVSFDDVREPERLARESLRRLAAGIPGRAPELEVLHGHPSTTLRHRAREGGYDLIAIGTRAPGSPSRSWEARPRSWRGTARSPSSSSGTRARRRGGPRRRDKNGPVAPTRVFLLDDHEIVRRGLRELLDAEDGFTVVGEAATAEEALERIPATSPDVAVLDVRLPDGDGVEVCREIRSLHPDINCLIFTSFADDEALFSAILAGAAGYVLKQVRGTDLVDAIHRVAQGQSLLDPSVTARVLDRLRAPHAPDDDVASLTDQERRILELIAEGLTNRQIGERMFLAEKTVKNYVSNVLMKLGMSRRSEAAAYAARLAERRRREGTG